MFAKISQKQILINQFSNININKQVQIVAVNYALILFEGKKIPDMKWVSKFIFKTKKI